MIETPHVSSPTLHWLVVWIVFCFVMAITMACIFEVEIIAKGDGKIIPVKRVQLIQPELSGQISRIHVDNGDLVKKDQLLIEIDPTEIQAEINKIELETEHLIIEGFRIETLLGSFNKIRGNEEEVDGSEFRPSFNVAELKDSENFDQQSQLYKAEIKEFKNYLDQYRKRVNSNKGSIEVIQSEINQVDSALDAQLKRISAMDGLLPLGVVSRLDHLDVKEGFDKLRIERETNYKKLAQVNSQEGAILAEEKSYIAGRLRELLSRKAEINSLLSLQKENLKQATYKRSTKHLKSPIDGYIDQLAVFTVGGVAQAGEELLRIVPANDRIVVESIFTNTDIGFLASGQKANVKMKAFPSERFGFVEGTVSYVSADAQQINESEWGFTVRVSLETPYLETKTESFKLKPGMTATVDVITGSRSIISYFFAPILKTLEGSMGER